jgi:methionine-S-sulfoxide reductase
MSFASMLVFAACSSNAAPPTSGPESLAPVPQAAPGQQVAVLAGGCFWCLEADMDKLPGVLHTTSGFAGGPEASPTYKQVVSGATSHLEAVHVVFDPAIVSYEGVLDFFWRHHDPTDGGGQFCDRGATYAPAIFPVDDAQKAVADASKKKLEKSNVLPGAIASTIVAGQRFWPAEVYHQDFYQTTPGRYVPYRIGCGRDAKTHEIWKNEPKVAPTP